MVSRKQLRWNLKKWCDEIWRNHMSESVRLDVRHRFRYYWKQKRHRKSRVTNCREGTHVKVTANDVDIVLPHRDTHRHTHGHTDTHGHRHTWTRSRSCTSSPHTFVFVVSAQTFFVALVHCTWCCWVKADWWYGDGRAYLKISGFTPWWILAIFAPPRLWPSTMSRTMEVGAQESQRTKNKRKQRKQHTEEHQDYQKEKTTKKDTGGETNNYSPFFFFGENVAGRSFHKKHGLCPCRCSGVSGLWFRFLRLMTFWNVKMVTREGSSKMAKILYGVKPDIFKRAAQKWPKFLVG